MSPSMKPALLSLAVLLSISIAHPQPTSLQIRGPSFFPRQPTGPSFRLYSAQLLTSDGRTVPHGSNISWSLSGLDGVSLSGQRITTEPTGPDGWVLLTAVDGLTQLRGVLNISVQALRPVGIGICGPSAIVVSRTDVVSATYTSATRDQQGGLVPTAPTSWSLLEYAPGILMSTDGVLSVKPSTVAVNVTLVASSGIVQGRQTVSVGGFHTASFFHNPDICVTITSSYTQPLSIHSANHPVRGWEWARSSHVSLPVPSGKPVSWILTNSRVSISSLVLTFSAGNLRLTSSWTVAAGGGPLEHAFAITNLGDEHVRFGDETQALSVLVKADRPAVLSQFSKTNFGPPTFLQHELVGSETLVTSCAGANFDDDKGVDRGQFIPVGVLTVEDPTTDSWHGVYFGYEWELGSYTVSTGHDRLEIRLVANPVFNESVVCAGGETIALPAGYFGTFNGDLDQGANSFKLWFWEHKVPRSLYNTPSEPWTEICFDPITGAIGEHLHREIPQKDYDSVAASGIEAIKIDFGWYGYLKNGSLAPIGSPGSQDWDYSPQDWPDGFDLQSNGGLVGLNVSLYMGGTYRNVDLNTIEGRDTQLAALAQRFDDGWFKMWRTDIYTANENPMPDTFRGVSNFLYIVDNLTASRDGFRWENCANGGHYKGMATARRFTHVTTNDECCDGGTMYRATLWVNSFAINPIQLKSDVMGASCVGIFHRQNASCSVDPAKQLPVPCNTSLISCEANRKFMARTSMLGAWELCAVDPADPTFVQHVHLYKTRQRPIPVSYTHLTLPTKRIV
eukprot:TRINITY_DN1125_c0_g1_i3.p1 TRINITY_DN1125_c0_g1~~TRINITY_DN1125_c0_g1_i3.p1  ORF type:complete len:790 (-),score=76.73 TRINITY_DN1125_c0_g1_i3:103-2472(-)